MRPLPEGPKQRVGFVGAPQILGVIPHQQKCRPQVVRLFLEERIEFGCRFAGVSLRPQPLGFGELRRSLDPVARKHPAVELEEHGFDGQRARFSGFLELLAPCNGFVVPASLNQLSQFVQVALGLFRVELSLVLGIHQPVKSAGEELAEATGPDHGNEHGDSDENPGAGEARRHQQQRCPAPNCPPAKICSPILARDQGVISAQPPGQGGCARQNADENQVHAIRIQTRFTI